MGARPAMIYSVFSIYDSKAEAYLPPFILIKQAQAKRAFADCVNSDSHQFGQNPADYTLFELGNFNDEDGQYLLHRANISLGNGLEYLEPDNAHGDSNNGRPPEKANSKLAPISPQPQLQQRAAGADSEE